MTAPDPTATGGRRCLNGFTWWIRATWTDSDPREAELVDDEVVGAWRDLVDAVRDWSRRSGDGR